MSASLASFRGTGHYDLVWFFQVRAWVLGGALDLAPDVVDIDDLEDEKILARSALPRRAAEERDLCDAGRPGSGPRRTSAAGVGCTVWPHSGLRSPSVCSDLDARRSGLPGVRVIANGYPPPDRPVGRPTVASPPVVTFQGTLRYPPNADAARYLVDDVGPHLRALGPRCPDPFGRSGTAGLAGPRRPPAVTMTGQVPDITDELARADVIVIPLRYGSGTRVKILEAFAHRIPVVSTTSEPRDWTSEPALTSWWPTIPKDWPGPAPPCSATPPFVRPWWSRLTPSTWPATGRR